jgi:hypothetical protein
MADRVRSSAPPDGFVATGVVLPPPTPTGSTATPETPPPNVDPNGLEPKADLENGPTPNSRSSKWSNRRSLDKRESSRRSRRRSGLVLKDVIEGVMVRVVIGIGVRIMDGIMKGRG